VKTEKHCLICTIYCYTCIDEVSQHDIAYLMDSETCAKSLRNPDLETNELGLWKDLFQGGNSEFFQWGQQNRRSQ